MIDEYQPDAVAVEDVFFAANAQSTIKLGQARGVALLAAANADITLAEDAPPDLEDLSTGVGNLPPELVAELHELGLL